MGILGYLFGKEPFLEEHDERIGREAFTFDENEDQIGTIEEVLRYINGDEIITLAYPSGLRTTISGKYVGIVSRWNSNGKD